MSKATRADERTDDEVAASIRMELRPYVDKACRILDCAKKNHGLTVAFQIGVDRYGRTLLGIDVFRAL